MPDVVSTIIAHAAKGALGPLGLRRRGRSRTWIDDRGWWLITVEFQPVRGHQGCYLNVGHQHLWVERDHLIFLRPDRPLGASRFVRFNDDEAVFRSVMADVAAVAAETVEGRRRDHGEGPIAVEKIATSNDDLEAGIALALLGRTADAANRLNGRVHSAYANQAARYAGVDAPTAAAIARKAVESTRSKLKLAGPWADWNA